MFVNFEHMLNNLSLATIAIIAHQSVSADSVSKTGTQSITVHVPGESGSKQGWIRKYEHVSDQVVRCPFGFRSPRMAMGPSLMACQAASRPVMSHQVMPE